MTVPDEFLHVYAQYRWHGDAVIRGTRQALLRLKKAVEDALEAGEGRAELLATDGEGYHLVVVASSTIAGVGQPQYTINLEYEASKREARFWGNFNRPSRCWEIEPSEDV